MFCKEHIREYNATYDYFKGMDDDALAKFREAEVIGHRPTWKMGPRGAQGRACRRDGLCRSAQHAPQRARAAPPTPPRRPATMRWRLKALHMLDLDANATDTSIKARYKDLVKRHHPDANGGDRSSEEKLREIIKAYNFLRSQKLV